MGELVGPIGATTIAAVVAVLVEVAKSNWDLSGRKALLVSFLISFLFFVPFELIWNWGEIQTAKLLYQSIFYAFAGWLIACGMYSAGKTIIRG